MNIDRIISKLKQELIKESEDNSNKELDQVIKKYIRKKVLSKREYFAVKDIYSVETQEHESGSLDTRILYEIDWNFFNTRCLRQRGYMSPLDGGWLFYSIELVRCLHNPYQESGADNDWYTLAVDTRELMNNLGLKPHETLFGVHFIIPTSVMDF